MTITSFKSSFLRSAIQYFLFSFQCLLVSVRSLSSCLLSFLVFPSFLSYLLSFLQRRVIRRQFLLKIWQLQLHFLLFIVFKSFLSSLTVCNTSLFLIWSVQLILSILRHHHILKLMKSSILKCMCQYGRNLGQTYSQINKNSPN
jgi:hypothetical protein